MLAPKCHSLVASAAVSALISKRADTIRGVVKKKGVVNDSASARPHPH